MPRTKTKPAPQPPPPAVNGPMGEVLTLAEAAAYLRLPEAEVARLVHTEGLPGRRWDRNGDSSRRRCKIGCVRRFRPHRARKRCLRAGSWKDDPDLEEMLKEIYKQRGRPMTEDGE